MTKWPLPGIAILLACIAAVPPDIVAQEVSEAPMPPVELPAPLERVLRDYERGWEGRNPDGLAGLFTEDGIILPSGRSPVRGRDGIAEAYRSAGGPLRLRALAYAEADTVGYIVGAYRWGADTVDTGKFVLALRRAPGGPWLIAADIDNTNRPRGPGS